MDGGLQDNEWKRIRADFELQASQYHDLKLSVYYVTREGASTNSTFAKPNHAISLWQSFGRVTSGESVENVLSARPTQFGLTNAEVSAFGVVIGTQTDLFCRMASRAGSLLPDVVNRTISLEVAKKFIEPNTEGKPVFVCNGNPLAKWLNLTLVATATWHPGRFRTETLAVDPFTASLTALDFVSTCVGKDVSKLPQTFGALSQMRFKVALSFPGERRSIVEPVALGLRESLGSAGVFYDKFYEAHLAKPNLDVTLQRIYHDQTDLNVVFVCKEYDEKEWCGLEWRAIRDLIKKGKDSKIMFFRFDDVDLPGLLSIDGYINLRDRSTEEIVQLICERVKGVC